MTHIVIVITDETIPRSIKLMIAASKCDLIHVIAGYSAILKYLDLIIPTLICYFPPRAE